MSHRGAWMPSRFPSWRARGDEHHLDEQCRSIPARPEARSVGDLRFKFELLDDLGDDPPKKQWIVKNIIARSETSAWIAPPGGLKSALLAELSFCVCALEDWHGYKTKRGGSVVYFALERGDLVKRRLRAYLLRSGLQKEYLSRTSPRSCLGWWT